MKTCLRPQLVYITGRSIAVRLLMTCLLCIAVAVCKIYAHIHILGYVELNVHVCSLCICSYFAVLVVSHNGTFVGTLFLIAAVPDLCLILIFIVFANGVDV